MECHRRDRYTDIGHGLVVSDFGCRPGQATAEFARGVDKDAHVRAFDINADFIARTRQRASSAGSHHRTFIGNRACSLAGCQARSCDRPQHHVYVRDPVAAFTEFRRVLKAKRSRARNRGRLGIHSGRAAGRGVESPGSCSQLGLANTRYWS